MRGRLWIVMAGLLGASAVAVGAYHAHGLEATLEQMSLEVGEIQRRSGFVETAYQYQLLHALALLGIAAFLRSGPYSRMANLAGWAFVIGIFLFSGSLYGLAITGHNLFAHVAPFGGITLIGGWILIALAGRSAADVDGNVSS